MGRRRSTTSVRLSESLGVVFAAALVLAGCSTSGTEGGQDDEAGLTVFAAASLKNSFTALADEFSETHGGVDVSLNFDGSQALVTQIEQGADADVVATADEKSMAKLGEKVADPQIFATNVLTIVTAPGNPKNIRTWDDLLKPGVQVVTPNPGSSGSAKWNLLAPFAAKSNGGLNEQAGLDYVAELVRDHTRVQPKSGREATTAFEQGQGDVLISYENEAIFLKNQNPTAKPGQRVDYVIPPETFKIENPVAVVNFSKEKEAANAFVSYLFTPPAQRLWAQQGFRPVDPTVIEETKDLFPGVITKLWTISELGKVLGEGTAAKNKGKDLKGWPAVDKALFGTSGAITEIYDAGGKV